MKSIKTTQKMHHDTYYREPRKLGLTIRIVSFWEIQNISDKLISDKDVIFKQEVVMVFPMDFYTLRKYYVSTCYMSK